MLKCDWDAFFCMSAGHVSRLHIFPASKRVSAPYPVGLKLTAFAAGRSQGPIRVDGARLHQPMTVELSSLFADFRGEEFVGLEILLVSAQASIDLETTSVFVEIESPSTTATFTPSRRRGRVERAVEIDRATGPAEILFTNAERAAFETRLSRQRGSEHISLSVAPASCLCTSIRDLGVKQSGAQQVASEASSERAPYAPPAFYLYREDIKGHLVAVEAA